jgi:predicted Zn-ribbon and HTH transcriptional regulator
MRKPHRRLRRMGEDINTIERMLFSATEHLSILRKDLAKTTDPHDTRKIVKYIRRTIEDIQAMQEELRCALHERPILINMRCKDCGDSFMATPSILYTMDIPCPTCSSELVDINYFREFVEGGG